MAVSISIIICTRNRAANLRLTLESVSKSVIPLGWEVELLVVDNGSSDSTKDLALSTHMPNMPVRYLSEPRTGKGYAYNSGMAAARGDIFLFTDDDVRVPTDWIEGMGRPILEGRAHAVQGGIKVAPHLERPWLTGALRVWVASVEDPVRAPEGLVGANMAFGRQALAITGGFDLRLGPGASGYFDDTVFGWALERAGQKILYQPAVTVEHHFAADRLTLRSYLSAARRMAASRALVIQMREGSVARPSFFSLLKQMPGFVVRVITQAFVFAKDRRPDAGFVLRYYQIKLWSELRKNST